MIRIATGRVEGSTIRLDQPVASSDGRGVRIVLEPVEEPEASLSSEEQPRAWDEWARRSPECPIEDEEDEEERENL